MRRRAFINIASAAALWPAISRVPATSQAADNRFSLSGNAVGLGQWGRQFRAANPGLGWVEGHTIEIEYRWAEGRAGQLRKSRESSSA
jgi:putative tryptophan/tyrosine transport system substrate-binding protein